MLKSLLITALLVAATGSPTILRADDITYNVDVTVGPGSLTGLITLSDLTSPGGPTVVSYDLKLSDGTHSVVLTPANSEFEDYDGSGLSISAKEITFDWSSDDQFSLLSPPPLSPPPPVGPSSGPGGKYDGVFCFSAIDQGDCAGQGKEGEAIIGSIDNAGPDTDVQAESGIEVIAVATPEPGTSGLLLIGAGLFSLITMRQRRLQDLPSSI